MTNKPNEGQKVTGEVAGDYTASSADLFKEFGATNDEADSAERGLNAVIRRENMKTEALPPEPSGEVERLLRDYYELCKSNAEVGEYGAGQAWAEKAAQLEAALSALPPKPVRVPCICDDGTDHSKIPPEPCDLCGGSGQIEELILPKPVQDVLKPRTDEAEALLQKMTEDLPGNENLLPEAISLFRKHARFASSITAWDLGDAIITEFEALTAAREQLGEGV